MRTYPFLIWDVIIVKCGLATTTQLVEDRQRLFGEDRFPELEAWLPARDKASPWGRWGGGPVPREVAPWNGGKHSIGALPDARTVAGLCRVAVTVGALGVGGVGGGDL